MTTKNLLTNVKATKTILRCFFKDENGATAIEYGLIVSLIFVAIVGSVQSYSDNTETLFSEISSSLD